MNEGIFKFSIKDKVRIKELKREGRVLSIWIVESGIKYLEIDKHYNKQGHFVIEAIQPYGKKVGKEVFDTVEFTGRFLERMESKYSNWKQTKINRRAVITHICEDAYGNDAKIRTKLLERFGKEFLHKLKADCWSAFALSVTFIDKQKVK